MTAGEGDFIWLNYGENEKRHNLLIDGGVKSCGEKFADVIRKTGLENVVIDNYVNTRKRKPATRPELMYIISKKKCVSLDVDSFIPGRFYLTFAPDSDGGDNDLSLVGTGLDLYWGVDDIKMFQMRGNANMAGVV